MLQYPGEVRSLDGQTGGALLQHGARVYGGDRSLESRFVEKAGEGRRRGPDLGYNGRDATAFCRDVRCLVEICVCICGLIYRSQDPPPPFSPRRDRGAAKTSTYGNTWTTAGFGKKGCLHPYPTYAAGQLDQL